MNKKILIPIIIAVVVIVIGVVIAGICINSNNKNENNSNSTSTSGDKTENNSNVENTSQTNNEINKNKDSVGNTENKANNEKNENETNTDNKIKDENKQEGDNKNMYSSGKHHATIIVKKYGTIKVELDADTAPITVANFAKLVNKGFYNGLTFHRIYSGFMIQGGDPLGNGTGGSDEEIKGEFALNGIENNISHKRGVISMARANAYDSASSQFFIVHEDSEFLDGQYAAFGKVTKGMKVVDKICEDATPIDDNGTILAGQQPIIEKITMDD